MARKPSGSPDLAEYHRKRDFEKTREPSGADRANGAAGNSFVVQKHAAAACTSISGSNSMAS